MRRSLGRWGKRLRQLGSSGLASFALVAGLTSAAGPPEVQEPASRINVVTEDPAILEQRAFLADLGVDRWHRHGYRGQGVKVAILDTGFRDYRTRLGQGLPAKVRTRSFRDDHDIEARDSSHGILCAEVLHTVAPDAELLLANWEPDTPESFLRALRWAKEEGARVASCSVVMPSWSDGEGGGPTHIGLREILGPGRSADDVLFFVSAGNLAQRHWSGTLDPDRMRYHQWSAGQPFNRITPWGNERIAVELYGGDAGRCVIQIHDAKTHEIVYRAESTAAANSRMTTVALRFDPEPGQQYELAIRCSSMVAGEEKVHVVVLGGNLEHGSRQGSIPFPGDGAGVVTLGAVDRDHRRLAYSSCGPNSRRPKPDFVAEVPFPSRCRARPFTGTSAAAPQGAGLAALLLSREPDWLPEQVHAALRSSATDLLTPGHDCETGYGLLRLP
jgi:subtilisin family serine protease